MKLHIDTTQKTIKVEGSESFKELIDELDKRFPDGEWKEYTLDGSNIIINNYGTYPVWPITYPTYPTITYLGTSGSVLAIQATV